MKNQEPWEPTFTAGYTLSPEKIYRGSGSARPAPGPAYTSRGTAVDTSAAPTSVATTAVAVSTARAEVARQISDGRGSSGGASGGGGKWGRGGGGMGGGGKGDEERLNAMAYNKAYVDGRWGLF